MKRLIALGVLVLVLLLGGALLLGGPLGQVVTAVTESDSDRAYRAALQGIALDRAQALSDLAIRQAQADAVRDQAQKDALLPVATGVELALLLLVPLLAGGALLLAADAYRLRRVPIYRIADGSAAFPRWYLEQSAEPGMLALGGYHQARIIAAGVPLPPTTYSPHIVYQNRQEGGTLTAPEAPGLLAPVPTYGELRARGLIGDGRPLVLGWAEGQPLLGSWKDLYSVAVAGISGSGKTTLERFIIGQAAEQGARLALLDPHSGKERDSLSQTLGPLHQAFICDPATDDRTMLLTLQLVDGHLQARLAGKERDRTPLIVVVDEFTRLMGRSALAGPMGALLEAIAQEGRGVNVFAMISGQVWSADRAGGTPLRDSLASAYVMRIKTRQARFLVNSDEIADCETLATGAAFFWRTSGEIDRLWIPNTTQEDIVDVAARYIPSRPQAAGKASPSRPTPRVTVLSDDGDGYPAAMGGSAAATAPTAEEAQIVALFTGGADIPSIIAQIWQVTSDSPRRYTPRYQQVQAVLRQALGGPGAG